MGRLLALALAGLPLAGLAALGCQDDREVAMSGPSALPPASTSIASAPTVTIRQGPNGGYVVEGAPPPKGDPKTCAAVDACCKSPELSLFCGLVRAAENDCTQQLKSVQEHLAERKLPKPAGCP